MQWVGSTSEQGPYRAVEERCRRFDVRLCARDWSAHQRCDLSPTGVLSSKSNHKICDLGVDNRSPGIRGTLRAVKLLSNELSEPARIGSGLATVATFSRAFRTSCLSIFASVNLSLIGQPQPTGQMRPDDSVLGGKIIRPAAATQCLLAADIRQNPCPMTTLHPR